MLVGKKVDLSKKAISKAVLKRSLQSPFLLYPTVVGVLSTAAMLFFDFSTIALMGAITGFAGASLGWIYEYFIQENNHIIAFLGQIHESMVVKRNEMLKKLESELNSVDSKEGIRQLELFKKKFDNFQDILQKKFTSTELTFSRYLAIAEQVFLAGLDNLEGVALGLKSVSAMDTESLHKKIVKLTEDGSATAELERKTLQSRLDMYESQLQRMHDLLVTNEQALTQIDNVSTQLANIKTTSGRAKVDMDIAMQELQQVAERATDYNLQQ
ncbi:hypothetical protein [Zooshikella sp. RANM57]|uniref:hypothetical protein n=1 Tax=Zooshikella sp. RANM57 TaxID=3425863 RepID=UPI003D6EA85A